MTEPMGDPAPTGFLDSLGPRALRRAEPRASIAMAAAGCALGIVGVLIVSGDTGFSDGDGDVNKVPGIVLCALVVAAGYFLMASVQRGAIATAGAVAAAIGVPPLMFFLTVDQNSFPPHSTEAILIVPTLVWLGTYCAGPGRGRPLFLGAGLLGLWASLLQLTEKLFDTPFIIFGSFATSFDDTGGFNQEFSPDYPSPTNIGLISLLLGVAYLFGARTLDRGGRHGAATPFALAALPTLILGTIFLADDLQSEGTGLLLLIIGIGLAHHGATTYRRATTWIGGALTAIGAATFLADMTDDATTGGMLFLAAGIAIVAAGHAFGVATHEADEMTITVGGPPLAIAEDGPRRRVLSAEPEAPAPDDSIWGAPPPSDDPPSL